MGWRTAAREEASGRGAWFVDTIAGYDPGHPVAPVFVGQERWLSLIQGQIT